MGNPVSRREENASARTPDSTLMLGYPSLHLWGRSAQNTGIHLPALQLNRGAGFGGSWSGCRVLAVASASTGGSALNYSDEMGRHKSPGIFFFFFLIKTKHNSRPQAPGLLNGEGFLSGLAGPPGHVCTAFLLRKYLW